MGTTFDSISRGLNEAVAHAKGKKVAVKMYKPGNGGLFRIVSSHGYDATTNCCPFWIFCRDIASLGARGPDTARRGAGIAQCNQACAGSRAGCIKLKGNGICSIVIFDVASLP